MSMARGQRRRQPEKKKQEVEIRDLRPYKEAKGGASSVKKDDKPASHRTGEIDFMQSVS
jgi:hypothetical protein